MKNKLILTVLTCCATFLSHAQDASNAYKPTAGNTTFEVGVNLYGGTFLQGGQVRLRRFTSEQMAYRYGASANYDYNKESVNASSSNLTLSFAPGVEKHFAGTEKLSPYLGFAVPLTWSRRHYENDVVEVKNGGSAGQYIEEKSYFSVGLNGLAGVDYYFTQKFYIGFEAGIGLSYFKYADAEIDYKQDDFNDRKEEGYHRIGLSPFTTGGLRLGFVF